MNERIKLLADEAGIPAIDGKWDYNDRNLLVKEDGEWRVAQLSEIISTMIQSERGLNKFAQLIVRECADVAKETRWAVPPSQEQIARGIQQHFGVEE
jgi:hypothetical protein